MLGKKERIDNILFDFSTTTQRANYKYGRITAQIPTFYKERKFKPREYEYKPGPYKPAPVPFSLLHQPKAIIRRCEFQFRVPATKATGKTQADIEARKTRPRLVMTPALSLDDVDDEHARDIVCGDTYTTQITKDLQEAVDAVPPYLRVDAPLPGIPAPAKPITLPKVTPEWVPPEWRMETVTWDNEQCRAYCEPDKEFWLGRDVKKTSQM